MTVKTKRKYERDRYFEVNMPVYGVENAIERWATYGQLILAKYGGGNLDIAWKNRDRARYARSTGWGVTNLHYMWETSNS